MNSDITQDILRNIQAEIVQLGTRLDGIDARLSRMENDLAGLMHITVSLSGNIHSLIEGVRRLDGAPQE
jgi:hypothetical protein